VHSASAKRNLGSTETLDDGRKIWELRHINRRRQADDLDR